MKTLRHTGYMALRDLRAMWRQPWYVAMTLVQPLIWLLLFGELFKAVPQYRVALAPYLDDPGSYTWWCDPTKPKEYLACGLPNVQATAYVPWLEGLFEERPQLVEGQLQPPPGPGLGLTLGADAVRRFLVPG